MQEKLTYKDAGVDKEAGYEAVELMKSHVRQTHGPQVLANLGGFAALYALDKDRYQEPVLVSGTDGVGTKLKLAIDWDGHDSIGQDCVAMCANDVLCQGARPLFFLDYFATAKLDPRVAARVVKSMADGCQLAGMALVGGETAEMPGFYQPGDYDVAGFCVGVVERARIIDGSRIQQGDILLGLPSNGLHSNGFSLVRKLLLEREGLGPDSLTPDGTRLRDELLRPTRIYVQPILALLERFEIKGLAHITGGGFIENLPRVIPEGLCAQVDTRAIPRQAIFDMIRERGRMDWAELFGTFNMGIGMIMVVAAELAEPIEQALAEMGERPCRLGQIAPGAKKIELVYPD